MPVFDSSESLYAILMEVFEQVSTQPENIQEFMRSNLVVRIRFSDPEAEILLDGRQPPLEVFTGSRPGDANLEITMQADLLHGIWTGAESTSQAFFNGKIKTKGNLFKAMKLVDLFHECERVYRPIAAEHGLV
jgi:putative sterol carrier protein